jgi:DNA-binding NtrC family response regulator
LVPNHGPVEVVLVDLDTPEVDGLEAAEVLAKQGIPVILITGMPNAEHLVVEHEPILVRLRKPTTVEAVGSAIRAALAGKGAN